MGEWMMGVIDMNKSALKLNAQTLAGEMFLLSGIVLTLESYLIYWNHIPKLGKDTKNKSNLLVGEIFLLPSIHPFMKMLEEGDVALKARISPNNYSITHPLMSITLSSVILSWFLPFVHDYPLSMDNNLTKGPNFFFYFFKKKKNIFLMELDGRANAVTAAAKSSKIRKQACFLMVAIWVFWIERI